LHDLCLGDGNRAVIEPAIRRREELSVRKAEELITRHVKDYRKVLLRGSRHKVTYLPSIGRNAAAIPSQPHGTAAEKYGSTPLFPFTDRSA
jgi:hypothetical protein